MWQWWRQTQIRTLPLETAIFICMIISTNHLGQPFHVQSWNPDIEEFENEHDYDIL